MSAAFLREASAAIRARAEAAEPGPWFVVAIPGHEFAADVGTTPDPDEGMGVCCGTLAEPSCDIEDAAHIASWHPAAALAVADWLDDIAERHKPDPEPADLTLHYDEPCPTGECVDVGYHEGCIVCWGCYPTFDGMEGRTLYPCAETTAAVKVAAAYLGRQPEDPQ